MYYNFVYIDVDYFTLYSYFLNKFKVYAYHYNKLIYS